MTAYEIYQESFNFLLYKITPNLRYIYMDIKLEENEIIFYCYYEHEPTQIEHELMNDVADNLIAVLDKEFERKVRLTVSTLDRTLIPKTDFLLYARYEE